MNHIKTGVEGLDTLLFGGFPIGRSILVSGEPGTGKTILCLQFLLEGLSNGEKALFITIDEKPDHLIADALALGWDLIPYLQTGQLQIMDVTSYFSTTSIGEYDGINIDQIIHDVMLHVRNTGATRLAIDPIAPLVFSGNGSPKVVEYIRKLIFELEASQLCTTLLTSYVPVGSDKVSHHGIEEFAASGIIVLKLASINQKYIRTLRVRKMRGTRIDLTEYSFEILSSRGLVLRQAV